MRISRFCAAASLLAAVAFVSPASGQTADADNALSPEQEKAIEGVIERYLEKNPEVVIRAIQAMQQRRRMAQVEAGRRALKAHAEAVYRNPDSPVSGNAKGDVTIVEFFDYRCGVCRRVHPLVTEMMKADPNLKRVYKEWPILGPESVFASRAALASRYQEKYFQFHDALMEAQVPLNEITILQIASKVGLDTDRLQQDMKKPEISAIIDRNYRIAEALNLNGTPSFVIGDQLLRGARDLQSMQQMVANARKAGTGHGGPAKASN